jgi:hypothetical protein
MVLTIGTVGLLSSPQIEIWVSVGAGNFEVLLHYPRLKSGFRLVQVFSRFFIIARFEIRVSVGGGNFEVKTIEIY